MAYILSLMDAMKENGRLSRIIKINRTINEISFAVHNGHSFDEIFEIIFTRLRQIIPYDRIGLSMLNEKRDQLTVVKVKSDSATTLGKGYSCPIAATSLGAVLEKKKPRIIDNLKDYVAQTGHRTWYNNMLIEEGILSSLTLPLFVNDAPTGFIFFSSKKADEYTEKNLKENYEPFMEFVVSMQDHLAIALEKGIAISRLQETNEMLNELNQMKDDFLSIASHDLRSPLSTIIGYGKMIKETELTELQARGINAIVRSAKHLLTLVDDILDLAKINSGKMQLELGSASIRSILNESLDAMSFNAESKDLEITREANYPEIVLTLDKSKIFQVFNNLIGNAIKFSPNGKTIAIRETFDEASYHFSISDEGPGISEEDIPRIFKKFSQVGTDGEARKKGTGLGLMICKMIVELHGGDIWVESRPGKGATFNFTLPVERSGTRQENQEKA